MILTLGLGTLVHFGKSHTFSASFVELIESVTGTNHFLFKEGKIDCILHNVLLPMGFKAWHRNKKKAYIVTFIFLKFKIRNKSYLK